MICGDFKAEKARLHCSKSIQQETHKRFFHPTAIIIITIIVTLRPPTLLTHVEMVNRQWRKIPQKETEISALM